MTMIQSGTARDVGTKFWEILDGTQTVMTKFNHNRFPHILNGVDVYFMDLDLDPRFCENVQGVMDVDGFISMATPAAGLETDAEEVLRRYIMAALLHALSLKGNARTKYLAQLRVKMNDIRVDADNAGSSVTCAILANHGIG